MSSTRGVKWAAMALAWLVVAAVVTLAIVRQNGRSEPSHSRATASFLSSSAGAPPAVELLAPPGTVDRPATLKAAARARSGRVVAVTFLLDGVPLGSDTLAPYTQLLNPGLIRPGSHRLRASAVDSLGRRRSTTPRTLTTERFRTKAVTATPQNGLARALAALRDGGVTVRLAPGRYQLHDAKLGDGARLLGSGPKTVIAAPSGASYFALLVARGRNIAISDLTVDGGGPGAGRGIAVAVFDGSRNVRLSRLRLTRVRTDGVNVWGAFANVSVQDSLIEGDGRAQTGVFALGSDRSRDMSVIRTKIRGFRSHGILLAQKEYGRPAAALHGLALDNVVTDIRDPARDGCTSEPHTTPRCGTNEGGIWTGGVEGAIIGNTILRARWDGIETVGSSTRTTVVGNEVRSTRTGIYLEHSTHDSLFSRNLVVDARTGINVEWWHEGQGSTRNTFTSNRIVSAGRTGLFVDVGGDGNQIVDNVFVGGARPAIVLQGSSNNVVRRNVGCPAGNEELVRERSAYYDSGARAVSRRNRIAGNTTSSSCAR
jgi:Periplasmic copper-binding protein (NosD)/Bacterial Ig domain